jgi:hypothetical protein
MDIETYISNQPSDRQDLLTKIHQAILENDKSVEAVIEPMMRMEMIIYKAKGTMKYGLASVQKYMSLHLLPIYGSQSLHTKYQTLLPNASFQKGCINFKNEDEMPIGIVQQLICDCAPIDLVKIREDYLKAKKAEKAKK